jgi:predicted secreted protein
MADVRVQVNGRVALLAHCLLNQNSKPHMRARYPGIVEPVLDVLRRLGYSLFQMPCPEVGFAGLNRFSQVIEQYDTAAHRRHCRSLASMVADQIDRYPTRDYSLVVLGIDGSPSCGIDLTGTSPEWKGYPGSSGVGEAYPIAKGRGIFMQELEKELELRGMEFPGAVGVALDRHGVDLEQVGPLLEKALRELEAGL